MFLELLKRRGLKAKQVAKELGVSEPAVSHWSRSRVPAERVIDIERVTGISRHDLRPDLYPVEAAQ